MSRIMTFVLSGDQTCSSYKMHSWMLRRTCRGITVLASNWDCSLVGLCGLIVCVTHHHYIDSLSFTIFQGNMSKMIKKMCFVDVHDGSWFIEVVLINMLSCHRQPFQQYRVWITLLFPVVSFKLPSMYGSTNILVFLCPFYILSICTLCDFLWWRMMATSGVFSCYGADSWHQWSTHGT